MARCDSHLDDEYDLIEFDEFEHKFDGLNVIDEFQHEFDGEYLVNEFQYLDEYEHKFEHLDLDDDNGSVKCKVFTDDN